MFVVGCAIMWYVIMWYVIMWEGISKGDGCGSVALCLGMEGRGCSFEGWMGWVGIGMGGNRN